MYLVSQILISIMLLNLSLRSPVGIYTVWQLLPRATNSANVKAVGRW